MAEVFTGRFARIDHPECFHRGDPCCRYIVTWDKSPAFLWTRVRNYSSALFILLSLAFLALLPLHHWLLASLIGLAAAFGGLQFVLQVVGEDGTEGWVFGDVDGASLGR